MFACLISACAVTTSQPPTHLIAEVHPGGTQRIAFSPSGQWLASGGLHGGLFVWSVAEGVLVHRLKAHRSRVRALAWRDETHLFSVDRKGELRLHDVESGRIQTQYSAGPVQAMVLTANRQRLLLGQGTRVLWIDATSLSVEAHYDVSSKVISLAVSVDGNQIAVSTANGRVQVADSSLTRWRELERPTTDANDLRFSPDGRTLLAGGWFGLLDWDVDSGTLQTRPTDHFGQVISVDISPDAQRWISLGRHTDSMLYLIDARNNHVLRRMQAHELCGWQARFSPNGRYVASAGEEGSIHIFDLEEPYRPVARWVDESE
ncbi:hypothetical protein MNBD_GAMMA15-1753 [hydrothermal vent metagenome]|uniref:WD40 repeat domain-containing protein n=1 Tax=hydrothermal vent metagenome TaxID=652676 RepID=A0A3B0Y2Z8_9ZZZZ